MTILTKLQALLLALLFVLETGIKKILAYPVYILVYPMLTRGWSDRYGNWFQYLLWLTMDEEQTVDNKPVQPQWFKDDYCGKGEFWCYYAWFRRNAFYNINYNYMSNHSEIMLSDKVFGDYPWNRKLRTRNGDDGHQFVWYYTKKKQTRFLYSYASKKINAYIGWNCSTKGRFTMAFKLIKE